MEEVEVLCEEAQWASEVMKNLKPSSRERRNLACEMVPCCWETRSIKIKSKIEKHGACSVCAVREWLWRMSTSRTRQVSTKVNCETCEKLRQSAQRNAAVPEQCGRRSYSGAAEQKVWDSLPARVCGRSWEDLHLARESDHGTLKHHSPSFFPESLDACWVLFQTFLIDSRSPISS